MQLAGTARNLFVSDIFLGWGGLMYTTRIHLKLQMDETLLLYTPEELPPKEEVKRVHKLSLSNYGKRAGVLVFTFVAYSWGVRPGTFELILSLLGRWGN